MIYFGFFIPISNACMII